MFVGWAHFTRSFDTIAVDASPALCSSPRSRTMLFLRERRVNAHGLRSFTESVGPTSFCERPSNPPTEPVKALGLDMCTAPMQHKVFSEFCNSRVRTVCRAAARCHLQPQPRATARFHESAEMTGAVPVKPPSITRIRAQQPRKMSLVTFQRRPAAPSAPMRAFVTGSSIPAAAFYLRAAQSRFVAVSRGRQGELNGKKLFRNLCDISLPKLAPLVSTTRREQRATRAFLFVGAGWSGAEPEPDPKTRKRSWCAVGPWRLTQRFAHAARSRPAHFRSQWPRGARRSRLAT